MVPLRLDHVTQLGAGDLEKKQRRRLAPKRDGLNIEALCASPDGGTLYVGFRNPRIRDEATGRRSALVVPLRNPAAVVERGDPPAFDKPILWDLQGLAIRAMEYSESHGTYFIIAGPHNGKHSFYLYRWSGEVDDSPAVLREIPLGESGLKPEALLAFRDASVLVLSDDGDLVMPVANAAECMEGRLRREGQCLNKHLRDSRRKCFRGIWLEP
jgi:hypothetical protein